MYVYIGESGDLGFNLRSSEYYVIGVMALREPKQIENAFKHYRFNGVKTIKIDHESSINDYCLQAVDFICGSVYRSYAMKDDTYFNIIKDNFKIKHEMWKRIW